ncbi:DUF488 domain-containing protein [Occallatibacter savannae]|uniref:DUF488 domain-containing protein n=1 Tax=Occallatibacter savannae TaxID=1002691 RepID=UPI0013A5505F
MSTVHTIGHSTHSCEELTHALKENRIEVLVDIRSTPYSSFSPQFDRELLKERLQQSGIKYLFLGAELGGRPGRSDYYDSRGRAVYGRMVSDVEFTAGIDRLERGMGEFRVAIMCGEEDPTHCHRRLLVSRVLIERGHDILHIRSNGRIQTETQLATDSGIELIDSQPALFAEMDQDRWRSTASVSHKRAPKDFSKP